MTTYKFIDGKEFRANSFAELAEHIRESSWFPGKSVYDYMRKFSSRARTLLGVKIRFERPEDFISDLLSYRILTEVILN